MGCTDSKIAHPQHHAKQHFKVSAVTTPTNERPFQKSVFQIRDSIIGEDITVAGSGLPLRTSGRKMLYTDYTASGRGVRLVEDFMTEEVLPMYANTHTMMSGTARQTTYFREEARALVKRYFNAGEGDALIFAGNGATGATSVFVNLLRRTRAFGTPEISYEGCMLIVDPMSHHSSILPYRELAKEDPDFYRTETVAIDVAKGHLCTQDLARLLAECEKEKLRPVAVLSAASNVTGISVDTAAVNTLVHAHGGVVCWDLAAVAGHMKVDLNPAPIGGKGDPSFDFAVVSPHKLLGGPGCVGVFFAKKKYLTNEVPCTVGGGVVRYVSLRAHSYVDNFEEREEAGTPNIVGCIKTGVVYRMHSMVDGTLIHKRETEMLQSLVRQLKAHPKVEILGEGCTAERVGILSFNVRYNSELYLHYNFVTVLLNDLFGIQVRGGCACAGPYSQWLLWRELPATGQDVLRPGFVRTGVHFTMTQEEVNTIAKAILWVANHGWKLLGAYNINIATGSWEYTHQQYRQERRSIAGSRLQLFGEMEKKSSYRQHRAMTMQEMVAEADELVKKVYSEEHVPLDKVVDDKLGPEVEEWVFFATPKDLVHSVRKVRGDVNSVKDWKGIVPVTEKPRKANWRVRRTRAPSSGVRRARTSST